MHVYRAVCALVIFAAPLSAQALSTDISIRNIATPQVTLQDRILAALELPLRTAEMRDAGVPDKGIRRLLDVMQSRNLQAAEQLDILTTERDAVREGKPRANFGAFVQSRLDAGLRGPALAQAIHSERLRRTPDPVDPDPVAYTNVPPPVSQLPDPAHARRHGARSRYHSTWGKRS